MAAVTQHIGSLLFSDELSDCTLVCEGEEIKGHRAIICCQSKVFKNDFDDAFRQSGTYLINVNFELPAVKRMMRYLYLGDYALPQIEEPSESHENTLSTHEEQSTDTNASAQDPVAESSGDIPPVEVPLQENPPSFTASLLTHVRMNVIGDFYNLEPLQTLANTYIEEILEEQFETSGFGEIINQSFTKTSNEQLQRIISNVAAMHIVDLLEEEEITYSPETIDFSRLLLADVVAEKTEREASLAAEIIALQADCDAKNEVNEQLQQKVQICLRVIQENVVCRNTNCSKAGTFQLVDTFAGCAIRCSKCRHTH